jgi:hypothetical protein
MGQVGATGVASCPRCRLRRGKYSRSRAQGSHQPTPQARDAPEPFSERRWTAARRACRARRSDRPGPARTTRGGSTPRPSTAIGPAGGRSSPEEPVAAAAAVDVQNAPTAAWKATEWFSKSAHRHGRQLVRKGTFLFRVDSTALTSGRRRCAWCKMPSNQGSPTD